jgi:Circularly permutated YpsA SLOG family
MGKGLTRRIDKGFCRDLLVRRIPMALEKIISGGRTGVDRAALDAALAANFPCGGWCPTDRKAEDGPIPERYPMFLMANSGYRERTLTNVQMSDGTAILFNQSLSGGTKLTRDMCIREKKPFVVLDATQITVERAVKAVLRFIDENEISTLNVAGPRASGWAEGCEFALAVVGGVIEKSVDG